MVIRVDQEVSPPPGLCVRKDFNSATHYRFFYCATRRTCTSKRKKGVTDRREVNLPKIRMQTFGKSFILSSITLSFYAYFFLNHSKKTGSVNDRCFMWLSMKSFSCRASCKRVTLV